MINSLPLAPADFKAGSDAQSYSNFYKGACVCV